MGLPVRPAKKTRGGAAAGVETAVECEAIPVDDLRALVTGWVAGLQPDGWESRWQARRDSARADVETWCAEHGVTI